VKRKKKDTILIIIMIKWKDYFEFTKRKEEKIHLGIATSMRLLGRMFKLASETVTEVMRIRKPVLLIKLQQSSFPFLSSTLFLFSISCHHWLVSHSLSF
jgi:hypothetical protein